MMRLYFKISTCLLILGILSVIVCCYVYELYFQMVHQSSVHMHIRGDGYTHRSKRMLSEVHVSSDGLPKYCYNTSHIQSWKMGVVTQLKPKVNKNCEVLAANSRVEIDRVAKALQTWKNRESYEAFVNRMSDCSNVMEEFSSLFYVSPMEEEFPLAYMLVVHTNARQVIRFLKAIYRPQNIYCIHPDERQQSDFIQVLSQISDCLDNVFVASKRTKVYYRHYSILEAQLNCMEDLIKYNESRWKYVINAVGRELPLKTNREIVNILSGLKGVSIVNSHPIEQRFWDERFQYKYTVSEGTGNTGYTSERLDPVPHGIEIFKGSTHFAVTRTFAEFLLTGEKAIDFRRYLKDVQSPEESFYASLYHLPEAELYGGNPKNTPGIPVWVESAFWLTQSNRSQEPLKYCSGKVVHSLCIANSGDLHRIYAQVLNGKQFFFNKYFMEEDHVVMDCMEERLIAHNMVEHVHDCM